MFFVDTNIFMYAVGKDHPYKKPSLRFFESVAEKDTKIAINTEVLQEILYRFWAIKKINQGFELFEYANALSEWVYPVSHEIIKRSKAIMQKRAGLSPRDALHAATMLEHRIATIISYDCDFDILKEIKRIEPE